MSWFLVFVGFSALIILHEAGHFAAAKAVGMRVERFFLFFPPKLFSVRRGETEYGIGAIPAGGFVKISGMNPDEELPPEVAHRAYYRQPVWKRIVVIGAGPAVNIVLAFLILSTLLVANGVQVPNNTVHSVTAEPAYLDLRAGDRILSVDGVKGDFQRMRQQISSHRCAGKPTNGCASATYATIVLQRGGKDLTVRVKPVYNAAADDMFVGFIAGTSPQSVDPVDAAHRSVDEMWFF